MTPITSILTEIRVFTRGPMARESVLQLVVLVSLPQYLHSTVETQAVLNMGLLPLRYIYSGVARKETSI